MRDPDEDKIVKIHLIRHGKTIANKKRLYCGRTDLPLSEAGATELIRLKNRGIYPAAGLFFTSGLLRTGQTMDMIYGKVSRKAVPDMAEYAFGLFEMKSHEELGERPDYQAWITDSSGDVPCPNGESRNQFTGRVTAGYRRLAEEIAKAGARSAVVVCHGGVVACVMQSLFPNESSFYEWQPEPGRGYTIIHDLEKTRVKSI